MPGHIDRRGFLRVGGLFLGAAGLTAAGCSATGNGGGAGGGTGGGTGGGGGGGGGGATNVRAAWWGGESRHAKFNSIYDLYQQQNEGTTIAREFADWTSYWERLPTQFAGGNAPDIVHMTERQIGDYAARDTVMNLQELADQGLIDLSGFRENSLQAGMFRGELVMLDIGGTIPASMFNTKLIEQAGMSAPPAGWDWDTFAQYSVDLTNALPDGVWGSAYSAGNSPLFETMLVQEGKTIFAPDAEPAINFEAADAERWFTLWRELMAAGGCVPIEVSAEDQGVPFEDSAFARGATAIYVQNHNQLVTYQAALPDTTLDVVAFPQIGAKPAALVLGSYVSISAGTEHAEESARIIDFFVNNPEANKIFGMELGVPGNSNWIEAIEGGLSDVEQKVIDFHTSVSDISVPATARAPGSSRSETLIVELATAVGFDEITPAEAGRRYAEELAAAVERG